MIEICNIAVSLDAMLPQNKELLLEELEANTGLSTSALLGFKISRKSIDARKKSNVHFVVSIALDESADLSNLRKNLLVREYIAPEPFAPKWAASLQDASIENSQQSSERPVIVGAGPAGLFCALYLARAGLRPLVIERGSCVSERVKKVEAFAAQGVLDPECNVQFGEGGAGTFSDGKLTTGTKSAHIKGVLREFVDAGAPKEILIDAKPHIGTDILREVITNIRGEIQSLGGEFMFDTRLDDIVIKDGRVVAIAVTQAQGGLHGGAQDAEKGGAQDAAPNFTQRKTELILCDTLVLAIGHSARDTFKMLFDKGVQMERKPFAVGVRIEHDQARINEAQYGKSAGHPALGAADYKLAHHNRDGRGVYTFCMCPGGEVVAASSEVGGVCTNGMSLHARNGTNANSALLVEVHPNDLEGEHPLEGINFQREIEQRAFVVAGSNYKAPSITVGDFTGHTEDAKSPIKPTYPLGVAETDLEEIFPQFITDAMKEALVELDKKLKGFAAPEAIMTAPEARSSSPVKILRDKDNLQAVGIRGLYPAGEGAGYAGGIMSAATDGIRIAEKIVAAL